MKRALSVLLAFVLVFGLLTAGVSAKTTSSAKAENVFFYASGSDGKSVLLKVIPLSELKKLSHGPEGGGNYYCSTTDNYPTTQYCESRGLTIGELVDYAKSVTTVKGAEKLAFSGEDTIRLMATDSYGSYSRSWTWDDLYGEQRYYFEGLYDASTGWNNGWEIAGEDNSKFGITLAEYNEKYKSSDPYYKNKRAVFAGGVKTEVILAVESYSGRTTSKTLVASTEPGIASYIEANNGKVTGCLSNVLSDEYALRLSLPMTEADLMTAHRTAFDNFKWIYNLRLDMKNAPKLSSLGTVADPVPTFSLKGNTLTITLKCATSGASIYYGYDGAPQTLYTGPVTVDVSKRDLTSDPVVVYATAVREGYSDGGVKTFQYPGMAPAFQTLYSGLAGSSLTFEAAESVTAADWSAWTKALTLITCKTPSAGGYVTVKAGQYKVDNTAKTIAFDKALFTENGSYSFIFHATKFSDKRASVTIKKAAPKISLKGTPVSGGAVTVSFEDEAYKNGLSVYITPEGGTRAMVSSSYLDRTQPGEVTVKAEYFAASAVSGSFTLELVNNSYEPSSQTLEVKTAGS